MGTRRHALYLCLCTLLVQNLGAYAILPKLNHGARFVPRDVAFGAQAGGNSSACDSPANTEESIWFKLHGSEDLVWTNCYQKLNNTMQCARLLVPLNYSAPLSNTNNASIALLRIPSTYPPCHPSYRGPILFNPGGPGGSGVDLLLVLGDTLSQIVGQEFDVVGFDPRGVGRSLPRIDLFRDRVQRTLFVATEGLVDPERESHVFGKYLARAGILGRLAKRTDGGGSEYLKFMQTDHTARDMLRITEKHGKDKLQYWGFSYGSILGASFAAMFPDKVERLIIDGVADAEDYFSTSWSNDLLDSNKTMQWFFDSCYQAGPSNCPFYASSPQAISERLTKLYDKVKAQPIPIVDVSTFPLSQFGVVDYAQLRNVIFAALYSPYTDFPVLAKGLAELEQENTSTLWTAINKRATPFRCSCGNDEDFKFESIGDDSSGIVCTDGKPIPGTLEDTQAHYTALRQMSEWADTWANIRIQCSSWPDFPRTFFRGPFEANTSHPLLLIGNTAVPFHYVLSGTLLTGPCSAKKMSKGFSGSVVLTQDTPGHTSLGGPSACTVKYVREYFLNGTLPPEGTVCPALGPPIPTNQTQVGDGNRTAMMSREEGSADQELEGLAYRLTGKYHLPRMV
ncbi:hypothetical protein AMATHDRAFT_78126 [Amanita thiersii Skay4041]|uniref:AB hydrolase-1 domain-containing protein n=1 Tax=Amanita thiersii Skay4041 TaxID=703135 RepID=A0A2A9NAR8_9AGAR|nr:hypothetical protein AMATHDRAFT_78126 [Amanita thiersii Skay4041]